MNEVVREDWHDCAEEADYWWTRYINATTLHEQAVCLVRLMDAMSDLRSWLPGFDIETGTMPWERDED